MRFLLQFRGLHNDLRLAEFSAALSAVRQQPETDINSILTPAYTAITGIPTDPNPDYGDAGAVLYGEIFYYADLLSIKEAIAVSKLTVLLRAIYLPVAHGPDYPSCVASIDKPPFENSLAPLRDDLKKPSFRCFVDVFGRSIPVSDQLEKIHVFSHVLRSFPGRVRMVNPDLELWILEDGFPRRGHGRRDRGEGPRQVLLGLKITSGQASVRAHYSLKTRHYIGPTSMDAELAFVMATMARVQPGHIVNDPFCGTAGVLVACAARGAITVGSDINILALYGKGDKETIASNFDQYRLPHPVGILRADVLHSPIRCRRGGWFDAVVCDPPYGIKEGTRVFREDTIDPRLEGNHFQGTERVRFVDFLSGVLSYAADVLVPGGRLVYWLPTATSDYREEDVPTHPALQLIHNNVQPLTTRMSRRLITMSRLSEAVEEANSRIADSAQLKRKNGFDNFEMKRMPGHFDLALKLMRQPERAESRLRSRTGT